MENKQYIKFYRYIRLTGTTASFLLFLFATLVCFPFAPKSSNLAEAANPPVESESTIAMVVGKSSASLSLTPSNPTGSFASSSTDELASFDVTTNNYTGYTLNIAASDDNGKLINSTTDTSLDSIDSVISESTFDNTLYNGKWGYNPSKYNSTENTSFRPAPTSDGSTLNVTKCANGAPTTTCPDNQAKDNYTIGLGARADLTTKYGTYSNTFVLTAVGNPVAYTLNYLDNSGDATVSNLPEKNSGNTSAVKVEISSQVPARTGYTFAGWCDEAPTINADGSSSCSGTSYQPSTVSNPTYYSFIDQTMSSSIGSLYATWSIASYLQTVEVRYQNASGGWGDYSEYSACTKNVNYGSTHSCSIDATTEYQAASLASYTVTGAATKQIDVYRNTRTVSLTAGTGISSVSVTGSGVKSGSGTASATVYYGGAVTISASMSSGYDWVNWTGSTTYSNQSQSISSVTSNLSFTANGKVSCQSTISGTMQAFNPSKLCSNAPTSGTLTDSRDSATYTVAKINNQWWMTQNLRFKGTSINSSTTNINTSKTISYGDLTSGDSYDEARIHDSGNTTNGVWYNYCAASAGTICTDSNSGEASYSLCPAGWRLPTYSEQSAITGYSSAYSPVTGGYYYNGSLDNASYGYWWSSTAADSTWRFSLYWYYSSLYTGSHRRYHGFYVRCVRSS